MTAYFQFHFLLLLFSLVGIAWLILYFGFLFYFGGLCKVHFILFGEYRFMSMKLTWMISTLSFSWLFDWGSVAHNLLLRMLAYNFRLNHFILLFLARWCEFAVLYYAFVLTAILMNILTENMLIFMFQLWIIGCLFDLFRFVYTFAFTLFHLVTLLKVPLFDDAPSLARWHTLIIGYIQITICHIDWFVLENGLPM